MCRPVGVEGQVGQKDTEAGEDLADDVEDPLVVAGDSADQFEVRTRGLRGDRDP